MDKAIRNRANTVPPFIDKEFLLIIFLFSNKTANERWVSSMMDKTQK